MTSSSALPDGSGEPGSRRQVRVRDFMRNDGIALESPDDRLSMDDTLMTGAFLHRELRPGLILHVSDAIEERAFTATSLLGEELSCIFFLEGNVDIAIGSRRFAFHAGRGAAEGVAIMNANPESFQRASRGCQHLRHLVISATPEWLHLDAMEEVGDSKGGARLMRDHLAEHRWTLTPRVVELVRQIFAPSPLVPALRDLYLEGRAVELVTETMTAVLHADRQQAEGGVLTRHNAACLQRARDFIAANCTEALSVETIARQAGISASGLQRLFRHTENRSIFEYVRIVRLEHAFDALNTGEVSVQEASAIAGYSNPANFATAFRRHFGNTPRSIRASRRA